jgi:hypothetical protein
MQVLKGDLAEFYRLDINLLLVMEAGGHANSCGDDYCCSK